MWWFSCFKSITGCHPPDALRTSNRTLAFLESSVTLWEIVFPRESEAEAVVS